MTWRPLLKMYLVKANTNNHVSEKEMVFRIQDGQEYLSIKFACDTNIKQYFHHILQPCDHDFPLSGADIIKITLGVMYDQRFIINIVICHKDLHRV